MPNQSGSIYGLTILSPIIIDPKDLVCHATAIRDFLATLPHDHNSPFAKVSSTHMARLVVMDDVVFVGTPAREERRLHSFEAVRIDGGVGADDGAGGPGLEPGSQTGVLVRAEMDDTVGAALAILVPDPAVAGQELLIVGRRHPAQDVGHGPLPRMSSGREAWPGLSSPRGSS